MLDDAPVDAEDCEVDDGWAVVVSGALVPEVLVCDTVLLELDGSVLELAGVLELAVVMLPLEAPPPTTPSVLVAEAVPVSDDDDGGALVADALLVSVADDASLVACVSLLAVDEIPPPIPPITVESEGAELIVEEAAVVDIVESVVWLAVPPVGEFAAGADQSESCGLGGASLGMNARPTERRACRQTTSPSVRPLLTSEGLGCSAERMSKHLCS